MVTARQGAGGRRRSDYNLIFKPDLVLVLDLAQKIALGHFS
jgi:hypothetical protein